MALDVAPSRASHDEWVDQFTVQTGYLNAATMGVPARPVSAAMERGLGDWAAGGACAMKYDGHVCRSRALYASLVGVEPDLVAVGSQVSVFAGLVAASVPDGAEVLCVEGDFSSMVFPFLAQRSRGLSVRHVPLNRLAEEVRDSTALVAFSLVQSACGSVADVDAVVSAAARHGALTFVDLTQSAGWLPFDASRADFTVCAGYKWLCNPRGTAYFTLRRGLVDILTPLFAGWYAGEEIWSSCYGPTMRLAASARRFDVSPAWLSWVGAEPALQFLLDVGVERVHAHNLELANAFRDGIGLEPSNSAIVSIARDGAQQRLESAGLRVSARAGRVRLAFHLWNTDHDVQRALAALR